MKALSVKKKRVVVKIGSSILSSSGGAFSKSSHANLCHQILRLMKDHEMVVVSSGAIALGMQVTQRKKRPKLMRELQACAAIGQGKLMNAYETFFSKKGKHTAQILLTRDGLEERERFLNARATLETLITQNILPVVNENDTVTTEEIAFGDNDILSVHVAHLVKADLLINLSNVNGFLLKTGERLREVCGVEKIDQELRGHLGTKSGETTVGGMAAKLNAARVAMQLGIPLQIVDGKRKNVIEAAVKGEDEGTLFHPKQGAVNSRRNWIGFSAKAYGTLSVDFGAFDAVARRSKSLLPGGITKVNGKFEKGQIVGIQNSDGKVFARGVARFSSEEIKKIAGRKSDELASVLGYDAHGEVIHRNDLVVWG
ncbi:MAG TPA: glutamate 5-kinase [Candidatus Omnitrophota bacterium]|nr:glutamate 5-kinase [Candidatus Omnitrophota bacterium]